MSGLLEGKVAVITGGAGAIGAATAELFARGGADVAVTDIEDARCEEVANRVRTLGRRALAVGGDLRDSATVARLGEAVESTFGSADILVNGLGHHLDTSPDFVSSDEEDWQALYEVNLLHVFRATQRFLPAMKAKGWGRIIAEGELELVAQALRRVMFP
jgi:NAD(P)-dependent dehydrogenase (short-subunit alcohol dehydrogenase family)